MKLTIVNCGDPDEYAVVRYQPMAPPYIAAYTPPDWQIELVDENWGRFDPHHCSSDLVAFSALPRHVDRAYSHARILRRRGITTVAGGLHVSAIPEEAIGHFDAIVEGEAEPVWETLLADAGVGRLQRHYISNFDQPLERLRLPDRRFIHPAYKIASLSTSRGCKNRCSFCYMSSLGKKAYREIPTETIIEDFRQVPQKMIVLTDANFLGFTDEHLASRFELCEALLHHGIKKYWAAQITADIVRHPELLALLYRAGCRMAFIGFETIGQDGLQSIHKDQYATLDYTAVVRTVQDAGIAVAASLILGLDTHDSSYEHRLSEWLEEARPLFLNLGVLTPMPNTELYRRMRAEGRLLFDGIELWKQMDKATNTIRCRHLTERQMEQAFANIVRRYFRKRSIARTYLDLLFARRQVVLSSLYLGAALRKRGNRCKTIPPPMERPPVPDRAGPGDLIEVTNPAPGGRPRPEPTRTAELSLLTWNINQWPLFWSARRDRQRLDLVRGSIRGFDLVCLQEAWSSTAQQIRSAFPDHILGQDRSLLGFGDGLLTLSRYPVTDRRFARYLHARIPDALAAKGISLARVAVPGFGEINVVNTHLQAWRGDGIRGCQIQELGQFVREFAGDGTTLLVGDLNACRGSEEYRLLQRELAFVDALVERPLPAAVPVEDPVKDARHSIRSTECIDHLLLLPGVGATVEVLESGTVQDEDGNGGASDHRGLFVRLHLSVEEDHAGHTNRE